MKKQRWLLTLIVTMILVPLAAVLLFSCYGIYSQRQAMAKTAQDFAQTLAQNLAGEYLPPESFSIQVRTRGRVSRYLQRTRSLKILQSGPPVHGWVAIFDFDGKLQYGSGGSTNLPEIERAVKDAIKQRTTQTATIRIGNNPTSALAAVPCPDGRHAAVAVISHLLIPPNMRFAINAMSYYGYATIVVVGIAVLGVYLLLKYCIWPLRSLATRIEALKWGHDTLSVKSFEPLPEIAEMQSALADLSERAVDREKLKKSYVDDIVRTQEDERTRIAREIHDSALQTISSLIVHIQLAIKGLSKENINLSRINGHLNTAQDACMAATQELRDVCDRLSPPWLSLGAEKALEEISIRLTRLHNINVTATVDGDASNLTEEQVRELCRIVQEAAANAAHHGSASNLNVTLICSDKEYILKAQDNGTGINKELDPEVLRVHGHRGIAGMNERASSIGGKFSIDNAEGVGALITVTIPKTVTKN